MVQRRTINHTDVPNPLATRPCIIEDHLLNTNHYGPALRYTAGQIVGRLGVLATSFQDTLRYRTRIIARPT